MQRFRIKGLLKLVGLLLILIMLGYTLVPPALLAIGKNYQQKGEGQRAKIYFDGLNQYFPHSRATAEGLEQAAQLTVSQNMLMVSPMGIGGTNRLGSHLSPEAQYYYGELAQRFPDTHQGKRARALLVIQQVKEHIYADQIDQAIDLIEKYLTEKTYSVMEYDLIMEGVRAFSAKGYYQEGIIVIEYALEKNPQGNFPDFYELLGDLYGALGEKEKAQHYYQKVLDSHQAMLDHERQFGDENHLQRTIQHIREKENEIARKLTRLTTEPAVNSIVQGRVTLVGKALEDVPIFLQPLNQPNTFPMGAPDALWGITDSKGQFTFENITPGRYGLGLVVDLDRVGEVVLQGGPFPKSIIHVEEGMTHNWDFNLVETIQAISPTDNKVIREDFIEFIWEPFKDAAYYTLELGVLLGNGWSSSPHPTKYYDNKARLSIEELRSIQTGMSYDEKGPTPMSLFGYAAPGGEYFWGVRAHSADGEILTTSRGYLKEQNTHFSFPKGEALEADRLLMDRKYGAAIEAYEKILQEDPNNLHALKILAAIYQVSIRAEHGDYPYTDFNKAILYYERLYDITGNMQFLDGALMVYYYSLNDYEKALMTLNKMAEQEPLNDWQHMMKARLESHFGNFREGLTDLLKANQRYHQEEGALRIITGQFNGITQFQDTRNIRWQKALEEYVNNYSSSEKAIKEAISNKPILEGLAYLENQTLSPVGELIELSLKILEPSLRAEVDELVDDFTKKYSVNNPKLAQIARGLYQ